MNSQLPTSDFQSYLKTKGRTIQSIDSYQRSVRQLIGWLTKEQIEAEQTTYNDLLGYIKALQNKQVKQRTIQNYITGISHYFDYLQAAGKIQANPTVDIEIHGVVRKKLYHIFQPDELHAIYNSHNDESPKGRRDKTMLGLLIYQGLQVEELGKMETDHIQLRSGQIEVPGGRRSNGRAMKLEPHQIMEMYDYILQTRPKILQQSNQQTDKLFVSTGSSTNIKNFVARLMRRLKKQNPHLQNANQIRASVITKWLRMYNLREVQHKAGHRYVSSTEAYQQNDMEGLQDKINQYHPLG